MWMRVITCMMLCITEFGSSAMDSLGKSIIFVIFFLQNSDNIFLCYRGIPKVNLSVIVRDLTLQWWRLITESWDFRKAILEQKGGLGD